MHGTMTPLTSLPLLPVAKKQIQFAVFRSALRPLRLPES